MRCSTCDSSTPHPWPSWLAVQHSLAPLLLLLVAPLPVLGLHAAAWAPLSLHAATSAAAAAGAALAAAAAAAVGFKGVERLPSVLGDE